ncbi:MAG: aminotransferase class V-fold PLP-dependent enzyme [Gemmatimonadota bacterium]
MSSSLDRRQFARLFALGGSAAFLGRSGLDLARPAPLGALSLRSAAGLWEDVRARFLMPPELAVLNAANLCPSPRSTLENVYQLTERMDTDPLPSFRTEMHGVKEGSRAKVARHLRVAPEHILITRNTSEANNWVSNGLDLGAGDEVLIFGDNHPSNHQAWREKAKRFGYTVKVVEQVNPHPGADYYLDAFARALTPRTRVLAFTHLTNTAGDLFPAKELCALAREHGALSLVDGAQSFGLLDVDLSDVDPDFYSGSAHKWPCGPKETGLLYVNPRVQGRFWPSLYSAYVGETGLSRTHEGMGQRDEPAIHALGEQMDFLGEIGQGRIEERSRELTSALVEALAAIDGVRLWTSTDATRRAAVVSFDPAGLDPRRLTDALESEGIVCSNRPGADRPGIRFAPHFYNSMEEIERAAGAIRKYVRQGV